MTKDDEADRDEVMEALDEIRDRLDDVELESTDPWEAFELWLDQQRGEKSAATMDTYERRVRPFVSYITSEFDLDDLNDLTTRHVKAYEATRKSRDLATNTLNNQLGTLRLFLEYCEDLRAIHPDVRHALDVPGLSKHDRVNTEKLPSQRAEQILHDLDRYEYASRRHVMFLLLWRTTMRIGTLHSLDVEDLYLDDEDRERIRQELAAAGYQQDVIDDLVDQAPIPFIWPRHRPDHETVLKKNWGGERTIGIAEWVADVLQDYLQVKHLNYEDEHGRHPLLPSKKGTGRLSASAIRNWCYILTQPCEFGAECPYDEDPETCEAREHGHGSKCPGSKSPHKVRTGSITWHRDQAWPPSLLAERANTSEQLIEDVYDQPEKLTRGANRRRFVDQLDDDNDTNEIDPQ